MTSNTGNNARDKALFQRLLMANQKQLGRVMAEIAELRCKGELDFDHTATNVSWDDAGRSMVNGVLSCVGPDISDVYAFSVTTGQWHEAGDDGKKIDNEMLQQELTRLANGKPTCVEFNVEKDGMSDKGYAINTEDDDVVIVRPSGNMSSYFIDDAGVLRTYPINGDKESAGAVEESTFEQYVKKAGKAPSKQTIIMEGEVPMVIIRNGKTEATIINYGGIGNKQDVSLVGQYDVPAFVIRASENHKEKLVRVPMSKINALFKSDGELKPATMADISTNIGSYYPHVGMDADVDLSKPEEYSNVRIQSAILAGSGGDSTMYYNAVNHYQTSDSRAPRTILLHSSPLGTSVIPAQRDLFKVQPNEYDEATGTFSSFNLKVTASDKEVDDQVYTKADKKEQADTGYGVASEIGPYTFPQMPNITMTTQLPIKPVQAERDPDADDFEPSFGYGLSGGGGDDGCIYRSLGASCDSPIAKVTASKLSYGSYSGDANKVPVARPERHETLEPTITITVYYTAQAPEGCDALPGECSIPTSVIKNVCKYMEKLYALMGDVKRLDDPEANIAIKMDTEEFKKVQEEIEVAAAAKVAALESPVSKITKKRRGVSGAPTIARMAS